MNRPRQDASEYLAPSPDLLAADAVPETLRALMRYLAEEYLQELRAQPLPYCPVALHRTA